MPAYIMKAVGIALCHLHYEAAECAVAVMVMMLHKCGRHQHSGGCQGFESPAPPCVDVQ